MCNHSRTAPNSMEEIRAEGVRGHARKLASAPALYIVLAGILPIYDTRQYL